MNDTNMFVPVQVRLREGRRVLEECVARSADELRFRVEMLTGIAWLEAEPLYREMLEAGRDQISDTFRVCHSYEKWGDLQQEVSDITVEMARLKT